MGKPMATNIQKVGNTVYMYDHHMERAEDIVKLGGVACKNGKEVAEHSDVVITMLQNALDTSHGVTPMQVLLAFVLSTPGTIAIPRSSKREHVLQNAAAASLEFTSDDLALLNRAFPAPMHKLPLDME